ncbi:heavy metal transporter [Streptomyces sp. NWU339]|uniref:heavy metal transporter n=1 Tax=Streptomyces sp. NWU339 TaxID=2185284 RepID=UPI000D683F60|nr:heavy metal transporter [Streptomyces sp. NWU339]PWI11880.1 heavy metal transporter [Streptomyces sp. NWU339]
MSEPPLPSKRRGRLFRFGAASVVLLGVAGYLVVQYDSGGGSGPGCRVVSGKGDGATYEFTPEQAVNAATITAVGTARELPERAVTIALATALQESALRNIDYGDRDSLGLFQQRPSQGWGTPEEIMDPVYSAEKFYEGLEKVPGYTRLPLTVAAQRVQLSGFPQAYAKHEPDATLLAAALTGHSAATLTCKGRPGTTRAADAEAVRAALARDFGGGTLKPAGAEVSDTADPPAPSPSPSSAAAAPLADADVDSDGRTVTLSVRADADAGQKAGAQGWQLAHWAVANASELHIERVAYAGREWTAGGADNQWRVLDGSTDGKNDGKNTEAAGEVRITTAR